MYGHLVTVEVGVVRCTNERMKLKCTTFYEYRFKSLNSESVECRSTVEENRVILDYIFKGIPYCCACSVNELSCTLDVCDNLCVNESLEYKRLEEFESHFLRETALVHLEFRSYDDN